MPDWVAKLTHINAALNGATIVLLAFALFFIRSGDRENHKRCMVGAIIVSAAFLVSYLIYHFNAGLAKFGGEGWIRPLYFSLLFLHVVAAMLITPLVPLTVFRAWRGDFPRHRRIARITWPIWMFVAVSGVIVYVMAVHVFPDPAGPFAAAPDAVAFGRARGDG
jgi:putative membrane protein